MILALELGLENEVPNGAHHPKVATTSVEYFTAVCNLVKKCTLLDLAFEAPALNTHLIFKPSSRRECIFTHSQHLTPCIQPENQKEAQTRHQSNEQGELSDRQTL